MPRPKTKKELLSLMNENYDKINSLVDSLDKKELSKEFPKGTLYRNIRDIIAHLHHWHLMTLKWYEVGMKGEKPDMPAKGYTWRTVPNLNKWIWEKYNSSKLGSLRKKLENSHRELEKIIKSHKDKELFEKKLYKWTGSTSLGSYLTSSTSSHYDWALKFIKKGLK